MADLTPLNSDPSLAPSSRRSTGTSNSGLEYYFYNAPEGSATPGSPAGMHFALSANGAGGGGGSTSRPDIGRMGGVSAFSSSSSLGVPLSPSVYAQARRQMSGESGTRGYVSSDGAVGAGTMAGHGGETMEEMRASLDAARLQAHEGIVGTGDQDQSPIPSPGVWSSASSSYSFGHGTGPAQGTAGGMSSSPVNMTSPAVQIWANDAAAALRDEPVHGAGNGATRDPYGRATGPSLSGGDFTYPLHMPPRHDSNTIATDEKASGYQTGSTYSSSGALSASGPQYVQGLSSPAKSSATDDFRTPTLNSHHSPGGPGSTSGSGAVSRTSGRAGMTPTGPSPSRYTPSSGRPVFNMPGYQQPSHNGEASQPRSAPAYKSDFASAGLAGLGMGPLAAGSSASTVGQVGKDGDEDDVLSLSTGAPGAAADFGSAGSNGEGEDTLKARAKRSTLPDGSVAVAASSGHLSPALNSEKRGRGSSPVPPPRSTLRNQLASLASPIPNLDLYSPPTSRPVSQSTTPPTRSHSQPEHQSLTPSQSQPVLVHAVPPSSSSSSIAPTYPPPLNRGSSKDSTTISDLAALLGGAIDEIGLIDSRETPPPTAGVTEGRESGQSRGQVERNIGGEDSTDRALANASQLPTLHTRASNPNLDRSENRSSRSSPRGHRPHIPGRTDSLSACGSGNGNDPVTGFVPITSSGPVPPPTMQPINDDQPPHAHEPSGVDRTRSVGADSTYSALTSGTAHTARSDNTRASEQSRQSMQSKQSMQSHRTSLTAFEARPWPAAMLYGHIRNMKHAGDRAKAYARGVNELARADTGLMEWCAMAISVPHRPLSRKSLDKLSSPSIRISSHSTHQPNYSSISSMSTVYAPGPGSTAPSSSDFLSFQPHPRTVSASSEFPMRDDHQTAREISQRVIDPAEPTGLPPNLPYPQIQQLQQQHQQQMHNQRSSLHAPTAGVGGMRHSPSSHSVASSHLHGHLQGGTAPAPIQIPSPVPAPAPAAKRGFFSALRSRKDPGLGPPTGVVPVSNISGVGSGPATSAAAVQAARNGSISAPIGPRAQSTGPLSLGGGGMAGSAGYGASAKPSGLSDEATPTRASFDVPSAASHALGYARGLGGSTGAVTGNRGSLDSYRMGAGAGAHLSGSGSLSKTGTPRGSVDRTHSAPPRRAEGGAIVVNEQDVRSVSDVLPHVDMAVVRAYLGRYGDQMTAIRRENRIMPYCDLMEIRQLMSSAYLEDEKRGAVAR